MNTTLPLPLEFLNDEAPLTIEIPLTKGYVAIVDAVDSDLAAMKWHAQISNRHVYAATNVLQSTGKYRIIKMHRLIVGRMIGYSLETFQEVDHIHGNTLDNRRSELRLCTGEQNAKNRKKNVNGKVQFKGVSPRENGKYRAQIQSNGKKIMLGTFDNPEDAYAAYCEAAKLLHGKFARLK